MLPGHRDVATILERDAVKIGAPLLEREDRRDRLEAFWRQRQNGMGNAGRGELVYSAR